MRQLLYLMTLARTLRSFKACIGDWYTTKSFLAAYFIQKALISLKFTDRFRIFFDCILVQEGVMFGIIKFSTILCMAPTNQIFQDDAQSNILCLWKVVVFIISLSNPDHVYVFHGSSNQCFSTNCLTAFFILTINAHWTKWQILQIFLSMDAVLVW